MKPTKRNNKSKKCRGTKKCERVSKRAIRVKKRHTKGGLITEYTTEGTEKLK